MFSCRFGVLWLLVFPLVFADLLFSVLPDLLFVYFAVCWFLFCLALFVGCFVYCCVACFGLSFRGCCLICLCLGLLLLFVVV